MRLISSLLFQNRLLQLAMRVVAGQTSIIVPWVILTKPLRRWSGEERRAVGGLLTCASYERGRRAGHAQGGAAGGCTRVHAGGR